MFLITIEETVCRGIASADTYTEHTTKKHYCTRETLADFIVQLKGHFDREIRDLGYPIRFAILNVVECHLTNGEIELLQAQQALFSSFMLIDWDDQYTVARKAS